MAGDEPRQGTQTLFDKVNLACDSARMNRELRIYRFILGFFIAGLAVSGLTAFPLRWEMKVLNSSLGLTNATADAPPSGLGHWLGTVQEGLDTTGERYPWMAYGTDW